MKSVSVKPGDTRVERMPSGASSCRITSRTARTADLVAGELLLGAGSEHDPSPASCQEPGGRRADAAPGTSDRHNLPGGPVTSVSVIGGLRSAVEHRHAVVAGVILQRGDRVSQAVRPGVFFQANGGHHAGVCFLTGGLRA